MKILITTLVLVLSLESFSQSDEALLEKALFNLPDVTFKKVSEPGAPFLKYSLSIKQPLDHSHPEKGFFNQRAVLIHKGFSNPTVMETNGYWLPARERSEIANLLTANYISIEYRFYGESLPDSLQWEYLTVEQATSDLHTMNQLFKTIYKGKWISTGRSKGGSTTIYYKYFFPDDVDLSIPYVAPLDNSLEDERIYAFLDTMGTQDCRNKIKQFQIYLLKHENEAIEKLTWYAKGAGAKYDYIGSVGKAFEYAVLEYPFSFWQYYDKGCESIPVNNVLDNYIDALLKTSDITFYSDKAIKQYEAHYYQAATQCGYYGYNIIPFKNYLHYFKENPSAIFPPKGVEIKPYDISLNQKVEKWLSDKGKNMIYIYGGDDTWTASGILPSSKVNSKRFLIPNTNHSTALILNMDSSMQQEFKRTIKTMIGMDIQTKELK